jgi:hypothetical protein
MAILKFLLVAACVVMSVVIIVGVVQRERSPVPLTCASINEQLEPYNKCLNLSSCRVTLDEIRKGLELGKQWHLHACAPEDKTARAVQP